MASSKNKLLAMSLGILLMSAPSQAQTTMSSAEFSDLGVGLAVRISVLGSQDIEFGRASLAMISSVYGAADGSPIRLSVVAPQVWLSSNLAMVGGIGIGTGVDDLVQVVRISLHYYPESISVRGLVPEFILSQSRITGLPSISTVKWNEAHLAYKTEIVGWQISGGLRLLYQRIFTVASFSADGESVRLVRSRRQLTASIGRNIGSWLAISAQGGLSATEPTGVFTVTVAL